VSGCITGELMLPSISPVKRAQKYVSSVATVCFSGGLDAVSALRRRPQ